MHTNNNNSKSNASPTPRHCNTGRTVQFAAYTHICIYCPLPQQNALPYLYTLFRKITIIIRAQKIRKSAVQNFVLYSGAICRRKNVSMHVQPQTIASPYKTSKNLKCTANSFSVVTVGGIAVRFTAPPVRTWQFLWHNVMSQWNTFIRVHIYSCCNKPTYGNIVW